METSQSFTIGKLDAGIAVLISDSVHLIEFPSLLLPPDVKPGSIVNISCTRNFALEKSESQAFWDLQSEILETFGRDEPKPPNLFLRNVTQTSVTLEWDRLYLATAKLLSLSLYRNSQRVTQIPNPLTTTSTKLSALSLDTPYTFHLVLKTTGGTFSSPVLNVRTHTLTETSGISVCFGDVRPPELLQQSMQALQDMQAKHSDEIRIDTTHFVCTSPAAANSDNRNPSVEYQRAMQLSLPIIRPEWLLACQREKRLVPIGSFGLASEPSQGTRQFVGPTGIPAQVPSGHRQTSSVSSPRASVAPSQSQARIQPSSSQDSQADISDPAQPPPPPFETQELEEPEEPPYSSVPPTETPEVQGVEET